MQIWGKVKEDELCCGLDATRKPGNSAIGYLNYFYLEGGRNEAGQKQ